MCTLPSLWYFAHYKCIFWIIRIKTTIPRLVGSTDIFNAQLPIFCQSQKGKHGVWQAIYHLAKEMITKVEPLWSFLDLKLCKERHLAPLSLSELMYMEHTHYCWIKEGPRWSKTSRCQLHLSITRLISFSEGTSIPIQTRGNRNG